MTKKIQKIILVLLLFVFLNTAFVPAAKADTWGANMMSVMLKQTMEEMTKSIYDTVVANLKISAIRILQAKLFSLLGSQGGSDPGLAGLIISDWKMFIYNSASRYSEQVTSDFFRGLSSGAAGPIQQRVINPAQMAVNTNYWSMQPNLQNYVSNGDASQIFQAGKAMNPWVAWRKAAEPQNDLAFTYLRAVSFKKSAYEQDAAAKQAEGVAGQGIKSKEEKPSWNMKKTGETMTTSSGAKVTVPTGSDYKGQKITTPGSIVGNLMNEIQMMPVRMLNFAQTIPQVVTAMANQMISQVIQQGTTSIINGGSGGGFDMSSMGSSMTSQMQNMIQGGVRTMASPNMFFGSGTGSSGSNSNVQFEYGTPTVTPKSTTEPVRGGQD